ncbi:MAG TPA: hypothetical protein VGU23_03465 [Acidobacteriaceae bacterium]|nr:hypothetical protein [Acidobacteriaceae bacterium]
MKRIVWIDPAKDDVRRIDLETSMRILTALDRFVRTGEGDVKAIQGRDELRLRVGDYWLFFVNIADALEVRRVLHRREAYRSPRTRCGSPKFRSVVESSERTRISAPPGMDQP